jgi:predicted transcriptional regulator
MQFLDPLASAGLTEAEAKVYLALLQSGPSPAGPIVKKSGLHRATTYQALQRLLEKGLASSIIVGKKRHFSAAAPQRLLDSLREREESVAQSISALSRLASSSRSKQEIVVYSGARGIRTVLDAMLEELGSGGQYCDFGVSGLFMDVMGPYWHLFQKRKQKQRIRSRVIFDENVKHGKPGLLQGYFGQCRFHPKKNSSLTDTMIYKDTVVLLIWTAAPPIAIVIKNEDNAKSYRNQFELMWKSASRANPAKPAPVE